MTEDTPILIGTLTKRQGINGFEVAEVGHPVFEYKDRYIIFLKSLYKTAEQIPDGNGGHTKNMVEYNVMIPYYKKSLSGIINFTNHEIAKR